MKNVLEADLHTALTLHAETAADLMEANPLAVRDVVTVKEATALLTDRGCSAAVVLNQANQLIGVLTRADILIHARERSDFSAGTAQADTNDTTQVRDVMTPAVFSVTQETPARRVIEEMVAMNVRQLFVVDRRSVPVGVISAFDIVKRLHP